MSTFRFIIFLLASSPILVFGNQGPRSLFFYFGSEKKQFLYFPEQRLTISALCGKDLSRATCLAVKSIKRVTLQGIRPGSLGSRNPGSFACAEVINGHVVTGLDSSRGENSFCQLSDGSLIDNGSLTYYARKNDAEKRR